MEKFFANRNYELVFYISYDLVTEKINQMILEYARQLKYSGACNIDIPVSIRKNLSYAIKKNTLGHFVEINFTSSPLFLPILEKKLRLDKNIIRAFIIKLKN